MRAAVLVLLGACGFDRPLMPGDGGDDDDAMTTGCTPGAAACDGLEIGTCNAEGTGIDRAKATRECKLACVGGGEPHCAAASNIPELLQQTCIDTPGPNLMPAAGSSVYISDANGATITCTPSCGSIVRRGSITQANGTDLSWFCLNTVSIASGITLTVDRNIASGIVWFATGPVTISGTLLVGGENAGQTTVGQAGPSGTRGGVLSDFTGDGLPAPGVCGGREGKGEVTNSDGSGGGGGGHLGPGGAGGDGANLALLIVPGGVAGVGGCATPDLRPLAGGFGGGGGGDGACGGTGKCGFPGGGGGGAIQISGRRGIRIDGVIDAHGGNGFGNGTDTNHKHGGGGGGGAGGAILLESWQIMFGPSAALDVRGGAGGSSGSGNGGAGATSTNAGSDGPDATVTDLGGAGGGGAAGAVRINGASCKATQPATACTSGAPPPQQSN